MTISKVSPMRLLFCCEFYHPSVGGVQEVMRQLAERMVRRGHQVTVATTRLASRDFTEWNGVRIEQFAVTGNLARGIHGEVERYQRFIAEFPCDAILIKAAQQWTFDATWPVLDRIAARKVFIPCGFSGLYDPLYADYFRDLPAVLRKFDHLIFYAERYRDVDFARAHGLANWSVVPNGASELEFVDAQPDPDLRATLGIPADSFLFATVGSLTGVKGHREVAEAFARLDTGGRHATLVLNGNVPLPPAVEIPPAANKPGGAADDGPSSGMIGRACRVFRREGVLGVARRLAPFGLYHLHRAIATIPVLHRALRAVLRQIPIVGERYRILADPLGYWINRADRQPLKQVVRCDLPRADVVRLFKTADLFVFASNIEYSPLVLFESAAAGTPFLTVPVGNAGEIARWTGAGIVCPAPADAFGFTRVQPKVLADAMRRAMADRDGLARLAAAGRKSWQERFTWDIIAGHYERILAGDIVESALPTGTDGR